MSCTLAFQVFGTMLHRLNSENLKQVKHSLKLSYSNQMESKNTSKVAFDFFSMINVLTLATLAFCFPSIPTQTSSASLPTQSPAIPHRMNDGWSEHSFNWDSEESLYADDWTSGSFHDSFTASDLEEEFWLDMNELGPPLDSATFLEEAFGNQSIEEAFANHSLDEQSSVQQTQVQVSTTDRIPQSIPTAIRMVRE